MSKPSKYILITPAHNEELLIKQTIQSVTSQSVKPIRWVIVDDASTDRTAEIANHYCFEYDFLKVVRIKRKIGRHFGNKAAAFNRGLAQCSDLSADFVGNLDADISLERTYFEEVLKEFDQNADLGLAGGMVYSLIDGEYVSQNVALDSVAGAVQLFRRECFEAVGGYIPLPYGGIDSAAEIIARMKGWKVQTFPQYRVLEHRRTGSATSGTLSARMKEGRLYYSLGYSPYFHLLRCFYRAKERPKIVGSVAEVVGFLAGALSGEGFALDSDVVHHLRNEQRLKLKLLLRQHIGLA